MERIKNILLYAGLNKDEYERVIPNINKVNRTMVVVFSGIATIAITIMFLLSFILSSTSQNRTAYVAGLIASLVLFFIVTVYAKNHSWIIVTLVYVSFSIFLIYGIIIGTITNPSQQTVTFMVMLVFLPVLFIDRPIRVILAMLIYVLVFIALCFKNKTGAVLSTDVMDAIIYGILGATSGAIINNIKVRSYSLEHRLHDASRYDQLTKMNNRNSFESDLKEYPSRCNERLTCVYIDVNGLHELNNAKGHELGDRMLQYIADCVKESFGEDYSYRIGGDEFVAFIPDVEHEIVSVKLQKMNEMIEREGYHVAIGSDTLAKAELVMDSIIKSAETNMYKAKSQFYKGGNRDRRRR